MTFDPTKPVQTRDGRKARVLATDIRAARAIVAAVELNDEEIVQCFNRDGRILNSWTEHSDDLINAPEKRTEMWWFNFYLNRGPHLHRTKPVADSFAVDDRIACKQFSLEYTVGEGLEEASE